MLSKFVLLIVAGVIFVFWPECFHGEKTINSKRIMAYVVFLFLGMIIFFGFKIDKVWLFILAGCKLSILNLYEACQMVFETDDERDMKRVRRVKLYLKSMAIIIVLQMYLFI